VTCDVKYTASSPCLPCCAVLAQIRFVLDLLEQHPSLEVVVVSDSDCVWLREPWQYLEQRGAADFFISTDCLSVKVRTGAVACRLWWRAGWLVSDSVTRMGSPLSPSATIYHFPSAIPD
jgi:hypothetical protein